MFLKQSKSNIFIIVFHAYFFFIWIYFMFREVIFWLISIDIYADTHQKCERENIVGAKYNEGRTIFSFTFLSA